MNELGFLRVAAASPRLRVADVDYNVAEILKIMQKADAQGVAVLCLPELCLTGYTCGDLFLQPALQRAAENGLRRIIDAKYKVTAIIGLPVNINGCLYNCAAVISSGKLLGIIPKTYIPNYNEFYEKRWFSPGTSCPELVNICGMTVFSGQGMLFDACNPWGNIPFAVEICEDLWAPNPPSGYLSQAGAYLIFNPSASTELVTKHHYRKNLISQQSGRCIAGYIYAGANHDESTTDVVYGGYCGIFENARCLGENDRFTRDASLTMADVDVERLMFLRGRNTTFFPQRSYNVRHVPFQLAKQDSGELNRWFDPHPFVPQGQERLERLKEITAIQTAGLTKRMEHTGLKKLVVGVSGGLDSALALLVAARAYKESGWLMEGILALTMPGPGTGERTLGNATALMSELGCTQRTINITPAVKQHFMDIGQDENVHDIAYENSQARERTQLLMDIANKEGALVLGTGDLSELALGWCTYNGDHMSMYNVNGSIPKTLVKHLVYYLGHEIFSAGVSKIVDDILDTPISPELIPSKPGEIDQRTEDILGRYDLHDFFLYHMLEGGASPKKLYVMAVQAFKDIADDGEIKNALKTFIQRFFSQQFKRSCLPDGPKVGTVSLSPRGDWRMPSDASAALWLKEVDGL